MARSTHLVEHLHLLWHFLILLLLVVFFPSRLLRGRRIFRGECLVLVLVLAPLPLFLVVLFVARLVRVLLFVFRGALNQ